jgi:hypothetical protein
MGKKMIVPLIEVLLNTQSDLINRQASTLLKDNFFRLNPKLQKAIDIDDIEDIDFLKNLSTEADKDSTIKKVFMLLS